MAENEGALKTVYESFMKAGEPKADIDSYSDWVKPHIKPIGGPAKGNADCKGNYDLRGKMKEVCKINYHAIPRRYWWFSDTGNNTCDNYFKVDMQFKRFMTEFFEASNTQELNSSCK